MCASMVPPGLRPAFVLRFVCWDLHTLWGITWGGKMGAELKWRAPTSLPQRTTKPTKSLLLLRQRAYYSLR